MQERHIFKNGPTLQEVQELARLTPGGVRDLVSQRSTKYRELGLAERRLSDAEWAELLSRQPGLFRRPLITDGQRLVIGYDQAALQALVKGSVA